jgi:hypothetical protein
VAACSESTSSPSLVDPAGVYSAIEFTATFNGMTVDELAEGVTLTITLAADGTTSGSLFVPVAGPNPVDLTGTWSRHGSVVTFQHATQTFIDVLPFEFSGDRLTAEGVVGPGTIRVILSR